MTKPTDAPKGRTGRYVVCAICSRYKKPIGRDSAPAMSGSYCDRFDCEGYDRDPQPDHLWPGEEEFYEPD